MSNDDLAITPGTYRLDPSHSNVGFAVVHKVSKFRAIFTDIDATLVVSEARELSLSGSVRVASVQVRNPAMLAHLQTPDFFDTERTPDITFASTSVRVSDGFRLNVTGDLTIRGHTEVVSAAGTLHYLEDDGHGKALAGIDLETTVDRRDFGLALSQRLPGGGVAFENTVTLTVDLELLKD